MNMILLKITGGLLLVLCGVGSGAAFAAQAQERRRQAQRFAELLDYLWQAVRYRAIPAQEVLTMAALHKDFAGFGLESCSSFAQIRVPPVVQRAMGTEMADGLRALESAPRESACHTLQHLSCLCRDIERKTGAEAERACRLYPRLGGCVGMLAAILLA